MCARVREAVLPFYLQTSSPSLHPWLIRSRSDYKDDGTNILLDANENAYGPGLALDNDGRLLASAAVTNGDGKDLTSTTPTQVDRQVDGQVAMSSANDVDLLGLNRYPDPWVAPLQSLNAHQKETHRLTDSQPSARPEATTVRPPQRLGRQFHRKLRSSLHLDLQHGPNDRHRRLKTHARAPLRGRRLRRGH